jgi:probable DNA metabolism protein
MNIYLHDSTSDSLLSAVYRASSSNEECRVVANKHFQPTLLDTPVHIESNRSYAQEVLNSLPVQLEARLILHASRNSDPEAGNWILRYIQTSQKKGCPIAGYHNLAEVKHVHQLAKQTTGEIHRFKGLLRFREMTEGWLLAEFEPDHDVLIPLCWYFKKRLRNERWIIHDCNRKITAVWDTNTLNIENNTSLPLFADDPEEPAFQQAWKTFFKQIAIEERSNEKLQRQFIPLRYRNHVTELDETV